MGLIFPIQPDLRASQAPQLLALKSSKKRFSLGMGFLFGAALLATMYLAASPLFILLWTEGGVFDQGLTIFILFLIALYPLIAIFCWFYEEVVLIEAKGQDLFSITAFEKFFSLKWNHRTLANFSSSQFSVENWKGTVNVASIDESATHQANRYSTKGHWLLKVKSPSLKAGEIILEKRARREDIDFVLAQVKFFFKAPQNLTESVLKSTNASDTTLQTTIKATVKATELEGNHQS